MKTLPPIAIILMAALMAPAADTLSTPAQASRVALADATAAGPASTAWRYAWIPDDDKNTAKALDVALNTSVSTAPVPVQSVRLAGGSLLRINLADLAPSPDEYARVVSVWERMAATEPYFLADQIVEATWRITTDCQLRQGREVLLQLSAGDPVEFVSRRKHAGNQWLAVRVEGQFGYVLASHCQRVDGDGFLRRFGDHCGPDAPRLADLCGSAVPIVRADWLLTRLMSTLDGGLYYAWRGITESPTKGVTDFEHFMSRLGVTTQQVELLRSDQKAAMFRSDITGKPRAVVLFQSPAARATVAQGIVAYTQDGTDEDSAADADPIRNLLDRRYDAIEVIAEMPNGFHLFGLFGGDLDGDGVFETRGARGEEGKLVLSAPDNVAVDHTVPAPHTRRLQPAISCIRCHSAADREHEGWRPVRNDVLDMMDRGVLVLGERTDGYPDPDTISRLAGLYSGRLEKPLQRARDDYAEAILRVTREPGDDGLTPFEAMSKVSDLYGEYVYAMVTPERACFELGYPEGDLGELLPPVDVVEDPILAALKAGVSVDRKQWEQVYADAALRVAGRENE